MFKVRFLFCFLLLLGFTVAEADLRIVGVSRMPDQDFYLGGDSVKFNVTVYNYGDLPGDGGILINATGNSPELDCPFLPVEPGFTSTAICPFEVIIKNTTTLVQIKLSSGGNLISTKNLTLFSTQEFQKKTKVPDSNPIVIILTVLIALAVMNFANNKPRKKRGQTAGEYITLVAGGALFVLIVIVLVNGFFNAPAKQAVITQGSLVQQQFGSLSKALEGKNPITLRRPLTYDNLATNPSVVAFQNNVCLLNATLFTDESGEMTAVSTLDDLENVETGTLESFQYQFARNGIWHYNVLVCTCENVCGWHFADADGNPQNQQIEIVPQGDQRYISAYKLYLARAQPFGISRGVSTLDSLNWNCNDGVPTATGQIKALGADLISAQLKCNIGGQLFQSLPKQIRQPGQYSLSIDVPEARGASLCLGRVCNSTDCMQTEQVQTNICQVFGQANPPANDNAITIDLGQNNDNILNFICQLTDANGQCSTPNSYRGIASYTLRSAALNSNMEQQLITATITLIDQNEQETQILLPGRDAGANGVDTYTDPQTGYSKRFDLPLNTPFTIRGWKLQVCNTISEQCYNSTGLGQVILRRP